LRLAAHFGLVPDSAVDIETLYTQTWIFDEVMRTKQPMIVGSAQDDVQLPAILRDAEIASLVILPLLTQAGENSRLLGCMLLGRKNNEAYSQDEVIRLMTIAEQIANLIDSDRRRQLAIALSEREKLMRDLHDSVSQKLYGLVTLTEAAQAALEAGSKVVPSQVLAKIGENARQAVKEMRLFLYQMQPVDLEKGDLVSALHHRLGAVEGRADIQARFIPDEGISVSKDKEIALYYIAQEALNNILKHARANTVLVKLRQTRKNVILEIIDNGEGFDPQNADQTGIGLQNIRSRTAQINGKLKIISKPGSGTTIKVMVGREKMSNQLKNRRGV
jgi:signal transduction histidine kinase